ncbi:phage tail tape measure protein [Citrobacter braakii]|nr:phage tail tape measure protein [Citrobacter braakii]
MAGNFKVGMTLTAKDDASAVLVKGLKLTTKAATEAEKAVERAGSEQQKSNEKNTRSARTAADEARRAAAARETLGVRSERTIQREIARTIASYNRLSRSGVASVREQERAFRSMKQQVKELRQEMRGFSRMSEARRIGGNMLAVGGGIAAATAVVARPVKRQMSYERNLSMMANTAFGDGGQAGRLAGRQKLADSIRQAVGYGGGSKESASEAMNQMLASGAVSYETANKWLPELMKFSTASGASAVDLSTLAVKAKQAFGLTDEQVPTALNMAIAAGKAGNVELKDMAKWLAPQMAAAGSAGMKGIDDFGKLLTLNEAAGITAGSSDEAGNNVVNLLAKLTSREAADSARRIKLNGHGIDLPGTLSSAREHGVDPIEAFNRVVDQVVGSDKRYQQLQTRMTGAKNKGERTAIMESMATILEGSDVGKMVADRQALMALLAYRNNPEYRKQVETQINAQRTLPAGQRAGDEDFNFIAGTNDFKVEQAANTVDFAQMDSVKKLADTAGSAAEEVSRLGQEFPGLTTAVAGATTAIQSMTAAAVAFAGIKFLTGGAAGAAAGATGAASAATTAAATAAKSGSLWGALGKLAGSAGLVTSLATMTSQEEDAAVSGSEDRWKAIREKYPQRVIDAARKKYQPWYQFGEGYSTENEEWIRRYLADEQNSPRGADINPAQVLPAGVPAAAGPGSGPNGATSQQTQATAQPTSPLHVTSTLVVDGRVLAETVNTYNIQDGGRGTGGPH